MKVEWKSCAKIGISAFLLYLCIAYWPFVAGAVSAFISAATPLLFGCVIAYIINILMSFYEKIYFPKTNKLGLNKSRRPVCMLAAFATVAFLAGLIVTLVIPELVSSIELLVGQIPGQVGVFLDWLEREEVISDKIISDDVFASLEAVDWRAKAEQIIDFLTKGVGNVAGTAFSAVSTFFSGMVAMLFALIFSIYLLSGKEKLSSQFDRVMKRYMNQTVYSKVIYVFKILDECFHRYIVGRCIEAVILGVLCMAGMLILRIPYAAMTGTVVAFTALIPVAGAYVGAGIGAFMILTVSPVKALVFLIFIAVLQQLEGNLIYPRVVGSSMGLPAIWVLAAVTVGGGMMGILGMLLGVPIAAALYRLLREDVNRNTKKEKEIKS